MVGMARAIARALPSSAPSPPRARREGQVRLSMTSMIDVLVVMTVFLLMSFTANGECGCQRDLSHLPEGANVLDIVDAPMLHVSAGAMVLDGIPVASRADLENPRAHRIDGLFDALRAKRETARLVAPNRPLPSHIILAIDGDTPAGVVKSIVLTAAHGGYPQIDFMVHARPRG